MSNYTLDFESDSEDENKEKQTRQTEECLNNYKGVFNNYREVTSLNSKPALTALHSSLTKNYFRSNLN